MTPSPRAQRTIDFFERLSPADIAHISAHYTDDAFFKDPFNAVRGHAAIAGIFTHMFAALNGPRFVVTDCVEQGEGCFLVWEFRFRMKRFDTQTEQVILGTSHLKYAADGRIAWHRDYWDAAEELYEKLPGLGPLMRWLKRQANS
jgi:ketosteroid isomerase-like protein